MSFLRYFSLIPTHFETYFVFKNNAISGNDEQSSFDSRRSRRVIRHDNINTSRRINNDHPNEDLPFEDVNNEGNCIFYGTKDDNELEKINDTESDKVSLWHFSGENCRDEKITKNEKKRKSKRGKKRRRVKCRTTQSSQSSSTNYIFHNLYLSNSERPNYMQGKRRNLQNSERKSQYKDIVAIQEPTINGFYYNYVINEEMSNQMSTKKDTNVEKHFFTSNSHYATKIPLQMQVTEFGEIKNKKVNCGPKKVRAKQREVCLLF
uniref:Homeobox protein 2-like n=1 Tax=Strongyloides papillosus TaxID=174720 RepID=A0A0N5C832_STREA